MAATVAVLTSSQLCVVSLPAGSLVCRALPGPGAMLLAAPDRRIVVPLRDEDATVVVDPAGNEERWRGRFMPLFFDEPDRAYVLLPGELVTLSYPDRAPFHRMRLEGVQGATAATVSPDGRLVAIAPAGQGPSSLVMVSARQLRVLERLAVPAAVVQVVLPPETESAVVGLADGRVGVAIPELGLVPPVLELPEAVSALAVSPDGRGLVAGSGKAGRGVLVFARLKANSGRPLKERSRMDVDGQVRALAYSGSDLICLIGERVSLRTGAGDTVKREVNVPGAVAMAVLPDKAGFAVPIWDEE